VQISALEIHTWGARADRLDRPDRIVLDLDPGPGVGWPALVRAARELHERLDLLGLASFVRTSGGKGLHVIVPIERRSTWDELKSFAQAVAVEMSRSDPASYVASMAKHEREGRIFIDYLRNVRGATSIASYSTRARRGAPLAMPLGWDELGDIRAGDAFDLRGSIERVRGRKDPWRGFFDVRQSIGPALRRMSRELERR
jgi:bifunctional non-homologous end joining protein LigD